MSEFSSKPGSVKMTKLYRCMLAALAIGIPGLALAQDSSGDNNSNAMLEEVVVTATKREERLIDVPVSISVLDASALESQNSFRLQDYFAQVPGLQLNASSSGSLQLAMRGISTGGSTNPTIALTIDDVPIGSSSSYTYAGLFAADIDPATLERVEALRGPQGTLYGASSLGGLIRYVTRRPVMNEFTGRMQLDAYDVNQGSSGFGARVYANVPLVEDRLAATISLFYREDPGVIDDPSRGLEDVDSADVKGGRISALWQASDTVSLRLSAMYQDTDGDGSSNVFSDRPDHAPDDPTQMYIAGTGDYDREISLLDANLDIDLGWANLTSITAYGENDFQQVFDVTNFLGFLTEIVTGRDDLGSTTFLPTHTEKFSQEIRLTSPGGETLEWQVGAFYTDEDSDAAYNIFASDPVTGEILQEIFPDSFPSSFKEWAVFGNTTYHFTDRFDLQVGARYSENRQVFDEYIAGPLYDPPYTVHAESKDDSFTYVISPQFAMGDNSQLYARLATGYRPGGPNAGAGFGTPPQYDADTTVSYELGWKADLADRRMTVDASIYYIDWKDVQLQQRDPVTEFLYYTNAGKARSKGADFLLQATPWDGMVLGATLAYSDAELTEATNGGIYGLPGDPLPFSAKWSGTLSAEQNFPLGDSLEGFVGGTFAYLDDRYGSFSPSAEVPRIHVPSYSTVDLRFGVNWQDWTFSLYGKNLTDERGIIGASNEVASGATGLYLLNIIRPRTFGISVIKEF